MRGYFWCAVALLLAASIPAGAAEPAKGKPAAETRPNIVFIGA